MNEQDVIKTLGHCTPEFCYHSCPYYGANRCVSKLNADAIVLLREKDKEIERLETINALHKENEKIIRNVIITEFAHRLVTYYNSLKSGLVAYHIEQIAKEMREKL